jgi:hypothetical protein
MTEPENSPPDVSPQLSNVQNSLYSVIENSKRQQWTITNYVILVYAAIFGLSRLLKPDLTLSERWVFSGLIVGAGIYAIFLLTQMQMNLGSYRKDLEAFHTHTISKEDKERYQLNKTYRYPHVLRGGSFLCALLGVVLIGAGLVIYSLWRT